MTLLVWILRLALGIVGLGSMGICGLAIAAPFHWILALFGAWDKLIIALGLSGLVAFWLGRWRAMALLQGVAVLALLFFNLRVPTVYPPLFQKKGDPSREFVLAWANIHDNRVALRNLAMLAEVKKAKAIGLGEVPASSNLQDLFPGIERQDLATPSQETWGVETLGCRLVKPNGEVSVGAGRSFGLKAHCDGFTLFVVHLQNPTRGRGEGLRVRNLELDVLARTVANEPGPVLVMGDFNTTPSALPFYKLLQTAGLKRVACGGTVAGTWRPIDWSGTAFDKIPGLRVTIDHILVRDLDVRACKIGPDVGSDHFPLIVSLNQPN